LFVGLLQVRTRKKQKSNPFLDVEAEVDEDEEEDDEDEEDQGIFGCYFFVQKAIYSEVVTDTLSCTS
jgi:transcription elongation factor SPT5